MRACLSSRASLLLHNGRCRRDGEGTLQGLLSRRHRRRRGAGGRGGQADQSMGAKPPTMSFLACLLMSDLCCRGAGRGEGAGGERACA